LILVGGSAAGGTVQVPFSNSYAGSWFIGSGHTLRLTNAAGLGTRGGTMTPA
jgi:hypothetical protein